MVDLLIRGIGVSKGIALGTAYVLDCLDCAATPRRTLQEAEVEGELTRFEAALNDAERELLALRERVDAKVGGDEADIFAAQALVVRDPSFRKQVVTNVREKRINVEGAVMDAIERFTRTFEKIADPYLRERAADIRDVGRRVLGALVDDRGPETLAVPEGAILVSDELLPSTTARLELEQVRALVTTHGGRFSHTSILARSMGTPAVVGVAEAAAQIKTGDQVIVDGIAGLVFVNPKAPVRREYERLEAEMAAYRRGLTQLTALPSVTADGTPVGLLANVSKFADTETALLYNAEGIGLYRTEFGYLVRPTFPNEDEQYEFLAMAAERFHPRKVVLRVLDLGADKTLPYFPLPAARNPSLAQRGIRLLLRHPELLKRQLRAFLRVSAAHPVSILLPVVAGIEDVRETRALVREAQAELSARGEPFNADVPIGAMIEVPSAALIAPLLAREVDFFSLGTNDLVQYVLAADREDDTVAPYYQPLHPGVLRLVEWVATAAREAGRPLTICGEMAGEPAYTELLIGLGLRELSVAPGEILRIKDAIRRVRLDEAQALARQALSLGSAAEIGALLEERRPRP